MLNVTYIPGDPYSRLELRPLRLIVTVAAAVGTLCFFIAPSSITKRVAIHIIPTALRLVPSVASIATETSNPMESEITLVIQWLFAPIYLFIWFYFYPPWSLRMRRTLAIASQSLTVIKRTVGFLFGIFFLGAWLLGDLNIINFPTFYNAKYVFPLSEGLPQLKLIYTSRLALAVYAWVGPVAEAAIAWMFSVLVFNSNVYLFPQQRV